MEIHLVSSLTPDDETRLAPAVLAAIGRILDDLPVTYSVRVETAAGGAIQHSHTTLPRAQVCPFPALRPVPPLEPPDDLASPYVKR